jgi:uncharacterized iron-regulated protein
MRSLRRALLILALAPCALADDIAKLPLGDPSRAYLLASGEGGEVIDCRATGEAVEFDALVQDLAQADVVLVGEHHTSLAGHQFQWRLFEALTAGGAGGRPIILGMEFFESSDDPVLARYIAGEIGLDEMLDQTQWYGAGTNYNFEYYRPLAETALKHRLPIRGINVPRELVRAVSRGNLDSLSPQDRELVGELGPPDERHRFLVNQMMDGLGAAMPQVFDGMYKGQTAWDSAMARSILRARGDASPGTGPLVVVIVGSGHVAHGLGIPARLLQADPSLRVRVLAPVQAERPDPDKPVHPGLEAEESAIFSRGYADWVYVLPDVGGAEEYPQMGLRLVLPAAGATSSPPGPIDIASVTPGGIAARAGLRKGDRLVAINGEPMQSVPHASRLLAGLRWDRRAEFDVLRPGAADSESTSEAPAEVRLAVLVVPPTDGDLDWLKSRPDSAILDDFDPRSTRGYLEDPKRKPDIAHARLVRFRDQEVRIDVMSGSQLLESWKLDDAGRPILGLLAAPASDGAVRIELDRDEDGAVTAERRFGADGSPIESSPHP